MIALDLDSHRSLVRRSERRKAANAPEKAVIEPLETERLPQLPTILEGIASVGFALAVFDTADADAVAMSIIALIGWNSLNWSFVDPYFCTLVFVSGPFFVGMSLANPPVEEVPAPGAHP